MKSKTAIEIIDSILLTFEPEVRNNMLDYIDHGYDVCSGRALARGKEWEDESESKTAMYIRSTAIDEFRKEFEL